MKQYNLTKKILIKKYHKENKTIFDIAKIIKCNPVTVYYALKRFNITIKGRNFKTILTKEFLYNNYVKKKKSSVEIAKSLKCDKAIVLYWLKKFNIKRRSNKENLKGKHNSPKTEWKKGCTSIFKNKKHTKETKLKLSKIAKKRLKNPKNNPMFGKIAKHGKGQYFKGSYMRSSWEIAFAKYCLRNKIKYRYESKTFEITYYYNDKKKIGTYTPDFYLPEKDLYIEIKGYWRDDAKVKFNSFKIQYPKIKINILFEKDLLDIGIVL